jgi:hypothetical protein
MQVRKQFLDFQKKDYGYVLDIFHRPRANSGSEHFPGQKKGAGGAAPDVNQIKRRFFKNEQDDSICSQIPFSGYLIPLQQDLSGSYFLLQQEGKRCHQGLSVLRI